MRLFVPAYGYRRLRCISLLWSTNNSANPTLEGAWRLVLTTVP